jgi:hypothetical protein
MAGAIDLYFSYRLLKTLTTPWEDQEAFSVGIIDKDGKLLVPRMKQTKEQKDVYTPFTRIGLNLKRIIDKTPGGHSVLKSYLAAFFLLKESESLDEDGEGAVNVAPGSPASGVDSYDKPLKIKKKKEKDFKDGIPETGRKIVEVDNYNLTSLEDYNTIDEEIRDMKDTASIVNTIKSITSEINALDEKTLIVVRGRKKVRLKRPNLKKIGYKVSDGQNVKMTPKEKRNRRISQKRGARKRQATSHIATLKREKSMKVASHLHKSAPQKVV